MSLIGVVKNQFDKEFLKSKKEELHNFVQSESMQYNKKQIIQYFTDKENRTYFEFNEIKSDNKVHLKFYVAIDGEEYDIYVYDDDKIYIEGLSKTMRKYFKSVPDLLWYCEMMELFPEEI